VVGGKFNSQPYFNSRLVQGYYHQQEKDHISYNHQCKVFDVKAPT